MRKNTDTALATVGKTAVTPDISCQRRQVMTSTGFFVVVFFGIFGLLAFCLSEPALVAVAGSSLIAAAGWLGVRLGEISRRGELLAQQEHEGRQQLARVEATLAIALQVLAEIESAQRRPANDAVRLAAEERFRALLHNYLTEIHNFRSEDDLALHAQTWRSLSYVLDHPPEVVVNFHALRSDIEATHERVEIAPIALGSGVRDLGVFVPQFDPPTTEMEMLARGLVGEFSRTRWPISATTRQRAAIPSLWAATMEWRKQGAMADLVVYPEGSTNCPAALDGLALPLIVMSVDRVAVVFDDAISGLHYKFVRREWLHGEKLSEENWPRIENCDRAYAEIHPELTRQVAGSWMVVESELESFGG